MGGMECKEDSSVNHTHKTGIGAYERFDVDGFPVTGEIVHDRIGAVV